ncbi:MAG TPA: primosomal protein N' [Pyrinomonadaceae bacterium]|nr:primosomal protein N' [Pyrinomonadaceae bacterium]
MSVPDTTSQEETAPKFAHVALPVHLRKLFTYRLPPSIQSAARVGSRVVVRLGNKPMTGYIVALLPRLREGTSLIESELKEIEELLDVEAALTPEVVELTRWVADYYAAPLGEVMRAALPAGINTSIMQVVAITERGRQTLAELTEAASEMKSELPAVAGGSSKQRALAILNKEGEAEVNAFSLRMGSARVPKWLRELESEGLIERAYRTRTTATRAKRQRLIRLVNDAEDEKRTAAQQRALEALRAHSGQMPLSALINKAQISASVIPTLKKKGVVEEFAEDLRRDPLARAELPRTEELKLTSAQSAALAEIESAIKDRKFSPLLLHGVTGSGKTEIYIRAMRAALNLGRGAMMLVPEIALTPILSRRLRAHFGDQIAIFHSSLSRGERFDEWSRLRTGEARVVLGTRSAVFAPVENLGLIVIDEEQDGSYRQEESPFYNARDSAIVRAQKSSATVVLGSATPSLESFHNAQTGKYQYLSLPSRIGERSLATAELIDMRAVFARHKKPTVFSDEVLAAIAETKANGEQSIILLNRRGYSSFILCRSCGESIMCPNCEVTLTYHRGDQTLVCHYCNHYQRAPSQCPVCASKYIYYVGEGTEQIEERLRKRFPQLRIGRIDRDTKSRRREFEKTLLDFEKGELDLLVGTQMLAKGHDFPNVTFVGVISVDAGLALPDFRAAERTFQLLTQVAGRAGRGERPGRVLIQTYHPHHYALRHAVAQDYAGFYNEEIRHRRNHQYPPFVALALLLTRHTDVNRAHEIAQQVRKALVEADTQRSCRILGPAPAPLARLRNEFRFHVLLKSRSRKQMRDVIDRALTMLEGAGQDLRHVSLEIDPISMM